MARPKGHPKSGGRKKGTPNKITSTLREMALKALELEGGVDYLRKVAREQPQAYLAFIGRFVPSEIKADLGTSVTLVLRDYTGVRWEEAAKEQASERPPLAEGV